MTDRDLHCSVIRNRLLKARKGLLLEARKQGRSLFMSCTLESPRLKKVLCHLNQTGQ